MESKSGRLLNVSEAAKILGIHPNTLRSWAERGLVPHGRTVTGYRRFDPAVIEELAAEMRGETEGKLVA